jgi:hypothetical protein
MILVTLRRREAAPGIETNDAQPDACFRGAKPTTFKRPAAGHPELDHCDALFPKIPCNIGGSQMP